MEDEIIKIRDLMRGIPKPTLSDSRKKEIRSHMMEQIKTPVDHRVLRGEVSTSMYVRAAVSNLRLSPYVKTSIKERIIAVVSESKQRRYIYIGVPVMAKRFVSACLVMFMCMGFFSFIGVDINVAMADTFTLVEDFRGEVVIEREGESREVKSEMKLYEGDVVSTGMDGWVSIRFFNDSIARLREGTSIRIKRLFEDPRNPSVTNVEVELDYGDVWMRVLNMFEEDSSFVVQAGKMLASAKKAAFNVHNDDDEAVVEVYSNVVEMGPSSGSGTKVKSGQMMVASNVSGSEIAANIPADVQDNDWVKSNLESDKEHIAKVDEDKENVLRDSVGSMPDSALYSVKSFKSGVVKLLTFDDIEDKKIDLDVSERRFVEWSVMLKEGEVEQSEAEVVFDEFVFEVGAFAKIISDVRLSGDDEYADELKDYLKSKISKQKRVLSGALPSSPLYTAKEYLLIAEIASAEDDAERSLVRKRQATLKLAEAQDLSEIGRDELVADVLDDYTIAVEEVKDEVDALSDDDKEEVNNVLVDEVDGDKDMISASEDLETVRDVVDTLVEDPVVLPSQHTSDYGVPVVGNGDEQKPLDPLLNF